jgi:formamidopyrimidine-DNA glycosylase
MPELAEVEIARRALTERLVGKGPVRLELRDTRLLKQGHIGPPASIACVRRRAKYLVLHHGQHRWVVHLRMTGRFTWQEGPGVRAVLHSEQGVPVYFEDKRCLGELRIFNVSDERAWFQDLALGEEPWPCIRSAAWWQARLGGLRSAVKVAMMRQDRVSGLGNIAASEILWRAQVDPMRPARGVSQAEWTRIGRETVAHLDHLLDVEDADIVYVTQGGHNPFQVYRRQGQPCPRCQAPLVRGVQSGRSTFYCLGCQPS